MELSPEPTPDWHESIDEWGTYWDVHIYFFGTSFSILGLLNISSAVLLGIAKRRRTSKRTFKCFLTINILLAFFNITRGLNLLADPYNSNINDLSIPSGAAFLVWGSTVPCFSAAFMLVNFTLLDVTKIQLYSSRLQSLKLIMCIVVFNFILVLAVDLVTVFLPSVYWLLHACQIFFLLLGILIAVSMIYSGYKVIGTVKRSRRKLMSFGNVNVSDGRDDFRKTRSRFQVNSEQDETERKGAEMKQAKFTVDTTSTDNGGLEIDANEALRPYHDESTVNEAYEKIEIEAKSTEVPTREVDIKRFSKHNNKSRLQGKRSTKNATLGIPKNILKLTVIVIIISICAILYSAAQLYSLLDVYNLSDPNYPIQEWPWFVFQTASRVLEVAMSSCLSYIVRGSISKRGTST